MQRIRQVSFKQIGSSHIDRAPNSVVTYFVLLLLGLQLSLQPAYIFFAFSDYRNLLIPLLFIFAFGGTIARAWWGPAIGLLAGLSDILYALDGSSFQISPFITAYTSYDLALMVLCLVELMFLRENTHIRAVPGFKKHVTTTMAILPNEK